ncbi:MAG: hypothetical protein AB7N76_10210 [Planctomycetota bacterium]
MRPYLLLLPLLAVGGCCSPPPRPAWLDADPKDDAEIGQALGQSSVEQALEQARRAAARKVAVKLEAVLRQSNTGAQSEELLSRMEEEAFRLGVVRQKYLVDCEPYEAAVLVSYDRAELERLARVGAGDGPQDTDRLLREGKDQLARQRFADATRTFGRLTQAQPGRADAWRLLGDALRADLEQEGVARVPGESERLEDHARGAYQRAAAEAARAKDDREAGAASSGLKALQDLAARRWRRDAAGLAQQALSGKRPAAEVLQRLVQALEPQTDPEQRRFLQDQALEVEGYALAVPLLEALQGVRGAVAVCPPEGSDEVVEGLVRRLGARLVDGHLTVRDSTACRTRLGATPGLAALQTQQGREDLRKKLEAEALVLVTLGQRVTATAYDLRTGEQRAPVARVFHPGPAVWKDSSWQEPDLTARITFFAQRLSADRTKLEEDLVLTDGVTLRDRDQLQCQVRLEQPAYVYLVWLDTSSGESWRASLELGKLTRGEHWLPGPGRDDFVTLGEAQGVETETLYVIVSREPAPGAAALPLPGVEQGGDRDGKLRGELSRQAKETTSLDVVAGKDEGVVLRGHERLVRELRFRHVGR